MIFAEFIGIIKGWSRDLAEYDDDDDKVEEKIDFDVSPIFPDIIKQKLRNFYYLLS